MMCKKCERGFYEETNKNNVTSYCIACDTRQGLSRIQEVSPINLQDNNIHIDPVRAEILTENLLLSMAQCMDDSAFKYIVQTSNVIH